MKYFLIAGEASGDMHGSNLIGAIKSLDKNSTFVGMGGDMMKEAGCQLVQNYRNMAYMGFVAVAMNWRKIRHNIVLAKQEITNYHPDNLILIDYPSFNLRIAKFVKQHFPDIHITYYIPPKIWAWKRWRVHQIAKFSNHILGIFPFEPNFYLKYGYNALYVGNPTVETIDNYLSGHQEIFKAKRIALVPGSRKYEVEKCLPVMLHAVEQWLGDYEVIITKAPTLSEDCYKRIILNTLGNEVKHISLSDSTYDVMASSVVAVVNSGTATLETALLGTPQVAVYHVEFPHLMGALRDVLFSIPYFTLVNIIADRQVIKELLAYEFTAENVRSEVERLLSDSEYRKSMLQGYREIKNILGTKKAAIEAAKIIVAD